MLLTNLRQALLRLLHAPLFTVIAILTLTLGIGANTAIFSVINGVLLRPLPYPEADRMMHLRQPQVAAGVEDSSFSFPEVADYRSLSKTIDQFVEFGDWTFNVLGRGEPHRATGGLVTANFFPMLGAQPLLGRMLVPEDRLVHAPLGVADEFFAPGEGALPPELRGATYLLNVAGNFPRKRLDILFRIFARLRGEFPSLLLVQHGAALDSAQLALLSDLGIADGVVRTPPLSRAGLAALYAHARLVVLTSEREGFGFPVLEALAAGAVVVLSEIPGFRETAADAGVFCVPGDVEGWVDVIRGLLNGSRGAPGLSIRSDRARRFSWTAHAAAVSEAYLRLAAPQ